MTVAPWLAALHRGALDLVFAPVCVSCREPVPRADTQRVVCRACLSRLRVLPAPRCARCWEPVPIGTVARLPCAACEAYPPALRALRSAVLIGGVARELVHALKYRGWQAAAAPMAHRMAALPWPWDVEEEARVVVPVPVSAARRRERGYNQAELLADSFAARTGRKCAADLLQRVRTTETQTALHPAERRANVAGAFAVPAAARARVHQMHLMLVDDVWTTGATALACAAALLQAGARAVSVVTFARALPERGA